MSSITKPRATTELLTIGGRRLALGPETPVDARIAAVAEAQYGALSLNQLRACGLGPSAVRSRVARGQLRKLHRAVFAPGHRRLPSKGPLAAAVLAYGAGAVLSHRSAAALHGLLRDNRATVDVTVTGAERSRAGRLRAHRARLSSSEVTVVAGIPTTTVARTILDCAAEIDTRAVERLCAEAELARVFDRAQLVRLVRRGTGHHGTKRLRAVLEELEHGASLTETDLEELLLGAFRSAGLPDPECQAEIPLGGGTHVRADFLRAERLVVEADGRRFHDRVQAYRSDRARDLALLRAGYSTVRFSDLDARDPARCAAAVAELLRARTAPER